jgi:hypothetical protein
MLSPELPEHPGVSAGVLLCNQCDVAGLLAGDKPAMNTIVVKAIDPRTIEVTTKANNVVTGVNTLSLSSDGRTFTDTAKMINAQGKQVAIDTLVFERVS